MNNRARTAKVMEEFGVRVIRNFARTSEGNPKPVLVAKLCTTA
jgi:hypothetical protein